MNIPAVSRALAFALLAGSVLSLPSSEALAKYEWKLSEALASKSTFAVHPIYAYRSRLLRGQPGYSEHSKYKYPDVDQATATSLECVAKTIVNRMRAAYPGLTIRIIEPEKRKALTMKGRKPRGPFYVYDALPENLVLEIYITVYKEHGGVPMSRKGTSLEFGARMSLWSNPAGERLWTSGSIMPWVHQKVTSVKELVAEDDVRLSPAKFAAGFCDSAVAKKTDELVQEIGDGPLVTTIDSVANPKKKMVVVSGGKDKNIKKKTRFWIAEKVTGDDPATPWLEETHFRAVGELRVAKVLDTTCEAKVKKLKGAKIEEITGYSLIEKTKAYKKRWKL